MKNFFLCSLFFAIVCTCYCNRFFIFDQTANEVGDVYNTWESLFAAVNSTSHMRTIYFQQGQIFVIPTGTYDMSEVTWVSSVNSCPREINMAKVILGDGVIVPNLRNIDGCIVVTCASTTSACSYQDSTTMGAMMISNNARIYTENGFAMWEIREDTTMNFFNYGQLGYVNNTVNITNGRSLSVVLKTGGVISTGSITV
jgi:hypothetical protein